MAEIRQITRRLETLEESIKTSPVMDSLAKADIVAVLEKRVADLETSVQTYKKFLEDALAKLGLLEQKVVAVETKVCRCGSECSASAVESPESPEPTVQMVMTENPVYLELETDDETA